MCVIYALVIARLGFETRQNEIETILYALRRNLKVIDGFCRLRKFCFCDFHYKSVAKKIYINKKNLKFNRFEAKT